MEFKTAEEKLLADYAALEAEVEALREQVKELKIERDHAEDCVKDMLSIGKFYGYDQPAKVAFDPMFGLEAE